MRRTTFDGNSCGFNGGALRLFGTVDIADSTVSNNSAANDGGGLISHGNITVTNVTVANNSAVEGGGAMFFEGTASLRYVTVARNSATNTGGGTAVPLANVTAINTIVCGNSAPTNANLSGTAFNAASSHNLLNLSVAAAFLGSLGDNGGSTQTIPLLLGSPAIDAGVAATGLTTDQRGLPRVINGTADIGAYEVQALPNVATPTVSNITATSATVSGNVSNDGFATIIKRGVVYARTSQNANPTIGGAGVADVDAAGTTGSFDVPLSGLTALTGYSFTSFVVTQSGTIYAPVQTFLTPEHPSLTVTTASDITNSFDGQTSLREAVAYANSLGGSQLRVITIPAGLGGQTINLSAAAGNADGWDATSALSITGNIFITGPSGSNQSGVTLGIDAGAALRHFVVRSGGSLTLMWLTLSGGKPQLTSFSRGAAISAFGNLTVRFCTFTGNIASSEGGAIQNWPGAGNLELVNCTFSGNSATSHGAAVSLHGTQATLTHLTITNNTAPNSALVLWGTQATMVNTILNGNSNDTVLTGNGGTFTAQSLNNLLGASSATGLTNGSNGNQLGVPVASLFLGPLTFNSIFSFTYSPGPTKTIAISPASLAFNAGAPGYQQSDQRGFSRPSLGAADIGALEVQEVTARVPTISPNGGLFENSVQVSINNPNAGASVRYTLDGSTPSDTNGILYTAPFNLTQSATVKAIAYDAGWTPSSVASIGVTVLTPLPYWRNLQGLAADGSQDLFTPAGDGVANLLKYAFNMAPKAGDVAKPNISVLQENGTAGLPYIEVDVQGRLTIEFVRRKASTTPGVTYIVETGDTLSSLQALDLTGASVVSIDAKWERVTVTDPTVTARCFGRVRIAALP